MILLGFVVMSGALIGLAIYCLFLQYGIDERDLTIEEHEDELARSEQENQDLMEVLEECNILMADSQVLLKKQQADLNEVAEVVKKAAAEMGIKETEEFDYSKN